MAQFETIGAEHRAFIERQRVFFVATAAPGSRINISPKGLDSLRVLDERTVVYLDLTGSGIETAAHIKADGRLTFMFCAFEGPPLILRLYGQGRVLPRGQREYTALLASHFGGGERDGARQMVRLDVELVLTSCGYGVPSLEFRSERTGLDAWAAHKGAAGLVEYRREKNVTSIDGLPSGYVEADV
jgi:pyridoxamine 5'-phosphate oxidase-like protein